MTGDSRGRYAAHAIVAAFAVTAFAFVLVATRRGPDVSYDSTVYVAGAQSLAAGDGIKSWDDRDISVFPPGFSAMLAAGEVLGADAVDTARWLHAIAASVLVGLTYLVASRHVVNRLVAVVAAGAVACASAMVDVFRHAWSEPVFCVLVMATLLVLDLIFARRARSPALIIAAGALSSVAFATRYIGVTMLGAALLVIVLAARRDGAPALWRRVGLYVIVAAIVPVVVMLRNLSIGVGPIGPARSDSTETVGGLAEKLVDSVSRWTAPRDFPAGVRLLVLGIVVTLVVFACVRASRQQGRAATRRSSLTPTLVVVGAYGGSLVLSVLTTGNDAVGLRLLAPLMAPMAVLGAVAVDTWIETSGSPRRARHVVAGLAAAWLMVSAGYALVYARAWGRSSHIHGVAPSRSIVDTVSNVGADALVVSNLPDSLFIETNRRPVYQSPPPGATRKAINALRERFAARGSGYLVWFDANAPLAANLSELRARGLHLDRIARATDGDLYRIEDVAHGVAGAQQRTSQ